MDEFDRAALDTILDGVPIRSEDLSQILSLVRRGQCCSLVGVSNMGKSWTLRLLLEEQTGKLCAFGQDGPNLVVFVNCLEASDSAQAFYELLLRRIVQETAASQVSASTVRALKALHQHMLRTQTEVGARALFGSSMHELACEPKLCLMLILDNFEDAFRRLPSWPFCQLRAQWDAWRGRLSVIVATHRRLEHLRDDRDTDEFREMFQLGTTILRPLGQADASRFLSHIAARQRIALRATHAEMAIKLSGGHPGLLETTYTLLGSLKTKPKTDLDSAMVSLLSHQPVRNELDRILESLTDDERNGLALVGTGQGQALRDSEHALLSELGLVVEKADGRLVVFSPLLAAYASQGFSYEQQTERGIHCDLNTHRVWIDGREVSWELTDQQRKLIGLLWQKRGVVCTRDQIIDHVWGVEGAVTPGAVRELASRLRKAIKDPGYIVAVHGGGYHLKKAA